MSFDTALAFVLKQEGGYVCDPLDRGGATCKGITQKVYDAWRTKHGLPAQSVRDISDDEVADIYRAQYWSPVGGDFFDDVLSLVLFDSAVNCGAGRAARWLQAAVHVTQDGAVGKQTIAAVHSLDEQQIAESIIDTRHDYYNTIVEHDPTQARFLNGWINRLADLKKEIRNGA